MLDNPKAITELTDILDKEAAEEHQIELE